jgi:hypothetical protein
MCDPSGYGAQFLLLFLIAHDLLNRPWASIHLVYCHGFPVAWPIMRSAKSFAALLAGCLPLAACAGGEYTLNSDSGSNGDDGAPPLNGINTKSIVCPAGQVGWTFPAPAAGGAGAAGAASGAAGKGGAGAAGGPVCVPATCPAGDKRDANMNCVVDLTLPHVSSFQVTKFDWSKPLNNESTPAPVTSLNRNVPSTFSLTAAVAGDAFDTDATVWLQISGLAYEDVDSVPGSGTKTSDHWANVTRTGHLCSLGSMKLTHANKNDPYVYGSSAMWLDETCIVAAKQWVADAKASFAARDGVSSPPTGWAETYTLAVSFDASGRVSLDGRNNNNAVNTIDLFYNDNTGVSDWLGYYNQSVVSLASAKDSGGNPFNPVVTKNTWANYQIVLQGGTVDSALLRIDATAQTNESLDLSYIWAAYGDQSIFSTTTKTKGGTGVSATVSCNPYARTGIYNSKANLHVTMRPNQANLPASASNTDTWVDTGRLYFKDSPLKKTSGEAVANTPAGRTVKGSLPLSNAARAKLFIDWDSVQTFDVQMCLEANDGTTGENSVYSTAAPPTEIGCTGGPTGFKVRPTSVSDPTSCVIRPMMVTRKNDGLIKVKPLAASDPVATGASQFGSTSLGAAQSNGGQASCDSGGCAMGAGYTLSTTGFLATTPVDLQFAGAKSDATASQESKASMFGLNMFDNKTDASKPEEQSAGKKLASSLSFQLIADGINKGVGEQPGPFKVEAGDTSIQGIDTLSVDATYTWPFVTPIGFFEVTIGAGIGLGVSSALSFVGTSAYPCANQGSKPCIGALPNQVSYQDATSACAASGGQLVEIQSLDDEHAVENAVTAKLGVSGRVWTGGTARVTYPDAQYACYASGGKSCTGQGTIALVWGGSGKNIGYFLNSGASFSSTDPTSGQALYSAFTPGPLPYYAINSALSAGSGFLDPVTQKSSKWQVESNANLHYPLCQWKPAKASTALGATLTPSLVASLDILGEVTYGKKDFMGVGLALDVHVIDVKFDWSIGYASQRLALLDGSCARLNQWQNKGTVTFGTLAGDVSAFLYAPLGTLGTTVFEWEGLTFPTKTLWDGPNPTFKTIPCQ